MANEGKTFDLIDGAPPTLDIQRLFSGSSNIRKHLDRLFREQGFGSLSNINALALKGINYLRHGQQFVQTTRDSMGLVFFTRPILNLTYENLVNVDTMLNLAFGEKTSLQNYVRVLLDPWGQMGKNQKGRAIRDCPLVDKANPFIPVLTNQCISLTGWKDIVLSTYSSPQGVNGEQWSSVEGHYHVTDSYEMNATFRNIEGDPISLLFQTWLQYMIECRHSGLLTPYPEFLDVRRYDYNTRIYRFVMDRTNKYITKYAATIAYPKSSPNGNIFNFSRDKHFNDANSEISITFACIGAEYNEIALLHDFNRLVAIYCPALEIDYSRYDKVNESLVIKQPGAYVKLKDHEKLLGNFLSIPLINIFTMELERWVRRDLYDEYINPKKVITDRVTRTAPKQTQSLNNQSYRPSRKFANIPGQII